jgi:hypothetical protein
MSGSPILKGEQSIAQLVNQINLNVSLKHIAYYIYNSAYSVFLY